MKHSVSLCDVFRLRKSYIAYEGIDVMLQSCLKDKDGSGAYPDLIRIGDYLKVDAYAHTSCLSVSLQESIMTTLIKLAK